MRALSISCLFLICCVLLSEAKRSKRRYGSQHIRSVATRNHHSVSDSDSDSDSDDDSKLALPDMSCKCSATGDPHFRTYDGQMIHYFGACKYTLSKVEGFGKCAFNIEVKNEERGKPGPTYVRSVDVQIGDHVFTLNKSRTLFVDLVEQDVPYTSDDGTKIFVSGILLQLISTKCNVEVSFDGSANVYVAVSSEYQSKMTGICGDCDGEQNDYRQRDGTDVSDDPQKFKLIGDSYEVVDLVNDQEGCKEADPIPQQVCSKEDKAFVDASGLCGICDTKVPDLAKCIKSKKVHSIGWQESCEIDLCLHIDDQCKRDELKCSMLAAIVEECAQAGFPGIDWRGEYDCQLRCGANMHYAAEQCPCPLSCQDVANGVKENSCPTLAPREGCQCNEGFVLKGPNECVPIDSCTPDIGPLPKPGEPCKCSAIGDPHFETFDGQMIHFFGTCKYTLVHYSASKCSFDVEIKTENRGRPAPSYVRLVDIKMNNHVYRLHQQRVLLVDNEKTELPYYYHDDISIFLSGTVLQFASESCGLLVGFDGISDVYVQLPATYEGKLSGICGDCDRQHNDYKTKEGVDVSREKQKFNLVCNSYQVQDDSDIASLDSETCQPPKDIPDVPFCSTSDRQIVTSIDMCGVDQSKVTKLASCANSGEINIKGWKTSCEMDLCIHIDNDVLMQSLKCEILAALVETCSLAGYTGIKWRDVYNCPLPCDENMEYISSGNPCPLTCSDLLDGKTDQPSCPELPKREGCFCKEGFVPSDKGCVAEDTCIPYKREDEEPCKCSAVGDPHFETFDGQMIHFMGTCKYTLVHYSGDSCSFDVEVKNELRGRAGVSYVRLVDIKIDGHVFRLQQNREFLLDGVKYTPPYALDQLARVFISGNLIQFTSIQCGLMVSFDGKSDAYVQLPSSYKGQLTGICGDCNGKLDDYRQKDGTDVSKEKQKFNLIGNSYAVTDDSDVAEGECILPDDYVDRCTDESKDTLASKDHCGVEKSSVDSLAKCVNSKKVNVKGWKQSCEIDLCLHIDDAAKMQDLKCNLLAALVEDCATEGFTGIDWRTEYNCPLTCGINMEYKSEVYPCEETCTDVLNGVKVASCPALPPREGCQCLPGFLLRDKDSCVPKESCTPFIRPPGEPCKCSALGDPHFETFDGQMIHFMGTCKYTLVSYTGDDCAFEVDVKNSIRGRPGPSYVQYVDINIAGHSYRLQQMKKFSIDGVNTPLSYTSDNDDINAYYSGNLLQFSSKKCSLLVSFNGNSNVYVQLPSAYAGKLTGICGDCDGVLNDYKTKEGIDVSSSPNKYNLIGDSYRVAGDPDETCEPTEPLPDDKCSATETQLIQSADYCGVTTSKVEKLADCVNSGKVNIKGWQASCEMDLCLHVDDANKMQDLKCELLAGLVEQCAAEGFTGIDWRALYNCPLTCGDNMEYAVSISACPLTCNDMLNSVEENNCLDLPQREGCQCLPNFVMADKKCVPITECTPFIRPSDIPCKCAALGDPHFETFDGQMIHFMGSCKYTLAAFSGDDDCAFEVQVKNEIRGRPGPTYVQYVDVIIGGNTYTLQKNFGLSVNGDAAQLTYHGKDVSVFVSGNLLQFASSNCGLLVSFDGTNAYVEVPSTYRAKLTGICGDCDGKLNDYRLKDGTDVSKKGQKFNLIGDSYQVSDAADTTDASCGPTEEFLFDCAPDNEAIVSNSDNCGVESSSVTSLVSCVNSGKINIKGWKASCEMDLCANIDDEAKLKNLRCTILAALVETCAGEGFTGIDWRAAYGCDLECPDGMTYAPSIEPCPLTCDDMLNRKTTNVCPATLPQREGCQCNKGTVAKGLNNCVPQDQCVPFVRPDTKPCKCSAIGDPHFQTYDGQMIHYLGACKYTLSAYSGDFCSFSVNVKNEIRNRPGPTYVKYVDVVIAGHVYRLGQKRVLMVDNVVQTVPFYFNDDISLFYSGNLLQFQSATCGLFVSFDGNSNAFVQVPVSYRGKLTGICGDCDGNLNDFKTKEGVDVSKQKLKFNLIGDSYQIPEDDSSDTTSDTCPPAPVIVDECSDAAKTKAASSDYCGVDSSSVADLVKCVNSGAINLQGWKASCEMDLCLHSDDAVRSEELKCDILAALVEDCAGEGFTGIDWRKAYNCPLQCGANMVYSPAMEPCPLSCEDLLEDRNEPVCFGQNKREGCKCEDGFVIKDGNTCVPRDSCIPFVRPSDEPCRCSASGDPHFKTFDGQMIHFFGSCKYTMVSYAGADCKFDVEVKNEARGKSGVTYVRLVDVKIAGNVYRLHQKRVLLVNGAVQTLPYYLADDIAIFVSGNMLQFQSSKCGLLVAFNGISDVSVELPITYADKLTGICGNCDGILNDYRLKSGLDVSKENPQKKFNMICDSYAVTDDSDKPETCVAETPDQPNTECSVGMKAIVTSGDHCDIEQSPVAALAKCATSGKINAQGWKESCQIDLCYHSGDDNAVQTLLCEMLASLVEDCAMEGFTGIDWRTEYNCPLVCSENMEYTTSMPPCPLTCNDVILEKKSNSCPGVPMRDGCQCKPGFLLKDVGVCVPENTCDPDGKKPDIDIPWCACTAIGDPHITTYDGQTIHYFGQCKYTLTKHIESDKCSFNVEIKNELRGRPGPTYVKFVDVTMNGHVFRLDQKRALFVDGAATSVPYDLNGEVEIFVSGTFLQFQSDRCQINVGFDGKSNVFVVVAGTYSKHMTGLCGDCNGVQDDFKTSAGVDVSLQQQKFNLIGDSYQVLDDTDIKGTCLPPPPMPDDFCTPENRQLVSGKQYCGVDKSPAPSLAMCSRSDKIDIIGWRYSCEMDLCIHIDEPAKMNELKCDMIAGLVEQCASINMMVRGWRERYNCPLICPEGMTYQTAMNACPLTCEDSLLGKKVNFCPKLPKRDGCYCADGYLSKGSKTCVKTETCLPPPVPCNVGPVDLVLLLDSSSSVGRKNWALQTQFAAQLVNNLPVKPSGFRVALVKFNTVNNLIFSFDVYDNSKDVSDTIAKTSYTEGGTNMGRAVKFIGDTILPTARKGVPVILILMTDGKNTDKKADPVVEAQGLKDRGVQIITLGITKDINAEQLEAMSSDGHFVNVADFTLLDNFVRTLAAKTCSSTSTTLAPVVVTRTTPCTCTAVGDPHIRTFDGQMIHFFGVCKYTLAKYEGADDTCNFDVEIKNEIRGRPGPSYVRLVDVKIFGHTYRLSQNRDFFVDGASFNVPYSNGVNVEVFYSGTVLQFRSAKCQVAVSFNGISNVYVQVDGKYATHLTGLCGDCDGLQNDFRTSDGKDVSTSPNKYNLVGNSYAVFDDSDTPLTTCPDAEPIPEPFCADAADLEVAMSTTYCNVQMVKEASIKACIDSKKVNLNNWKDSCMIDICSNSDLNTKALNVIRCEMAANLAQECSAAGFTNLDWRKFYKCPLTCPANSVYVKQMDPCALTCEDILAGITARSCQELPKQDGCQCKDGFVSQKNGCVAISSCHP